MNTEMEAWVERQKPQTQDKFRKVSAVVLSDTNFWKNLDMCSRIFEPALQALRVSDGMQGGTPAILYDLCLGLDKLYGEPICLVMLVTKRDRWESTSQRASNV